MQHKIEGLNYSVRCGGTFCHPSKWSRDRLLESLCHRTSPTTKTETHSRDPTENGLGVVLLVSLEIKLMHASIKCDENMAMIDPEPPSFRSISVMEIGVTNVGSSRTTTPLKLPDRHRSRERGQFHT